MFKSLVNQIQNFFGISRKEARAALVLMILSFFLLWTPFIFRRWVLPLFPANSSKVDTKKLDEIADKLEEAPEESESFSKSYNKPESEKTPAREIRLFRFDPNQATVDELETLGIPKFIAKRIDKYRSKGGQFRKKEDLLHIYDFPADVYKRLETYISIPAGEGKSSKFAKNEKSYSEKFPASTFKKETRTYTKPVIAAFDINTADTTQLISLKGIGTKLSLRILKFRDGLGGFHSADQFSEVFGLDSLALSELSRYGKIMSPVKKLNINTVTVEQLSSHSYLRNKKLASVIVNYRTQHGPYASVEDLRKIRVLDEVTISKLAPYLVF